MKNSDEVKKKAKKTRFLEQVWFQIQELVEKSLRLSDEWMTYLSKRSETFADLPFKPQFFSLTANQFSQAGSYDIPK